jgi:hypothetical protein
MGNRAGVGAAVVIGKLVVGEFFELRAGFQDKDAALARDAVDLAIGDKG